MAKFCNASLLARKLIGVFLISVFAISITPVIFLHDVIANHTDVCYHNFHEKGKQVSQADINCKCVSFVAEAQFLQTLSLFRIATCEEAVIVKNVFYSTVFYSQPHLFSELRGPPSLS